MNKKEYYTAPSQEVFETIKKKAIELWDTYDNEFGYATEKTDQIKNFENIRDTACYIVAMFDVNNQQRLFYSLEEDSKTRIWLGDLLFNNQTHIRND